MGVCDISADADGSIEFTSRFTSIEEPFLLFNPESEEFKEKIAEYEDGDVLFHSVDHLPAEMPKEASNHFGSKLMPFIEKVARSDFAKPFAEQDDIPLEIKGAVICCHGELTPDYEYIAKLREMNERANSEISDEDYIGGVKGFTLALTGHLFDTKCFNNCLDICENHGLNFRVIQWELGTK